MTPAPSSSYHHLSTDTQLKLKCDKPKGPSNSTPYTPERSFIGETLTVLEGLSSSIEARTSELSTRQLALDQREAHLTLAESALEARRQQLDRREANLAKRENAFLADLEKAAASAVAGGDQASQTSTDSAASPNAAILEKLASLEQAVDSTWRDNRRLTLSVRDLIASSKQLRQQLAAQQDTVRSQAQQLDATRRDLRQTRAQLKLAKAIANTSKGPRRHGPTDTEAVTGEGSTGGGGNSVDQLIRLRAQLTSATTQLTQSKLVIHQLESDLQCAQSHLTMAHQDHEQKQSELHHLTRLLIATMTSGGSVPPFSSFAHITHLLCQPILAAIARAGVLTGASVVDSSWRSAFTHALASSSESLSAAWLLAEDAPKGLSTDNQVSLATALLTQIDSFNAEGVSEAIDTLLLICTALADNSLSETPNLSSLKLLVHTLFRLLVSPPASSIPPLSSCTAAASVPEKAACALLSLLIYTSSISSPSIHLPFLLPADFDSIAAVVLGDLVDHGIVYKVSPRSGTAAVPGLVPIVDPDFPLMAVHACLQALLTVAEVDPAWMAAQSRTAQQVVGVLGLLEEVHEGVGGDEGDEGRGNVLDKSVSGLRQRVREVMEVIDRERRK